MACFNVLFTHRESLFFVCSVYMGFVDCLPGFSKQHLSRHMMLKVKQTHYAFKRHTCTQARAQKHSFIVSVFFFTTWMSPTSFVYLQLSLCVYYYAHAPCKGKGSKGRVHFSICTFQALSYILTHESNITLCCTLNSEKTWCRPLQLQELPSYIQSALDLQNPGKDSCLCTPFLPI